REAPVGRRRVRSTRYRRHRRRCRKARSRRPSATWQEPWRGETYHGGRQQMLAAVADTAYFAATGVTWRMRVFSSAPVPLLMKAVAAVVSLGKVPVAQAVFAVAVRTSEGLWQTAASRVVKEAGSSMVLPPNVAASAPPAASRTAI